MSNDGAAGAILFGITFLAIVVYLVVSNVYLLVGTDSEYIVAVQEKWIKGQGEDGQKYLFSDMTGNVYSIEDSYWKWTFDASDRYANLKENHTYHIKTFGRRSHWFSNYPNAIEIKEE